MDHHRVDPGFTTVNPALPVDEWCVNAALDGDVSVPLNDLELWMAVMRATGRGLTAQRIAALLSLPLDTVFRVRGMRFRPHMKVGPLEDLELLAERGMDLRTAALTMGVTEDAIRKRLKRTDRGDILDALSRNARSRRSEELAAAI